MARRRQARLTLGGLCVMLAVGVRVHAQPAAIELSGGMGAPTGTACVTVALVPGAEPVFGISLDLQFAGAPVSISADKDCAFLPAGASLVKACANRSDVLLRCGVYTEPLAVLPAGDLLQCCFAVLPTALPGSYPVTDQCDAVDDFGNAVPVACGAGTITIEQPSPTPFPSETPTATSTETREPTCTVTPTATNTFTLSLTPSDTPTPSVTPIRCVGDCDGRGSVTIDEILTMVNIALDNGHSDACKAGDSSHDGAITVDEILVAVNHALSGCPE